MSHSRESIAGVITLLMDAIKQLRQALILASFCYPVVVATSANAAEDIVQYQAEIVNVYPHDTNAYTQGLVIVDGQLYEGTGRNGQSSLRRVELDSGELLQRRNLSNRYFGEGITILGDKIYQLTWRSSLGFVYDKTSFNLESTFFLPGEGWGITHDGENLIVSDGTAFLRFLDPQTQDEIRRVEVIGSEGPVDRINELEYIDGEVWANVWYSDSLIRIDPETGQINSIVDLSDLYESRNSRDDVLNGIAWDADAQRLFVTGKLWPNLFEIKILE